MFNKDYFEGKTSNYKFSYESLRSKLLWASKIKRVLRLKNKGKLLDIGCAYGYFAKFMSKYFTVKGIDISDYAINRAKKELGENNAKVHDITKPIPFKDKFDIITAFDVIEHVPNAKKALTNISKAMNKNAYLIIDMPIKCDNKIIKFMLNDTDKTHNHLLEYKQIHELINKTGFKIINERNLLVIIRGLVKIPTLKPRNYIELTLQKRDK